MAGLNGDCKDSLIQISGRSVTGINGTNWPRLVRSLRFSGTHPINRRRTLCQLSGKQLRAVGTSTALAPVYFEWIRNAVFWQEKCIRLMILFFVVFLFDILYFPFAFQIYHSPIHKQAESKSVLQFLCQVHCPLLCLFPFRPVHFPSVYLYLFLPSQWN